MLFCWFGWGFYYFFVGGAIDFGLVRYCYYLFRMKNIKLYIILVLLMAVFAPRGYAQWKERPVGASGSVVFRDSVGNVISVPDSDSSSAASSALGSSSGSSSGTTSSASGISSAGSSFGDSSVRDLESDSAQRVQFHMSVGTGVYSVWGNVRSYVGVAPRIEYKASDKVKLDGGFAVVSDLSNNGYRIQGTQSRNLAPVKNGTQLGAVHGGVEYKANDRLLVRGDVFYVGGLYEPLYCPMLGTQEVSVVGGTASLRYRTKKDSFIDVHMTIVRDNRGGFLDDRNGFRCSLGDYYYGPAMIGSPYFW